MKLLVFALLAAATFAEQNHYGPEYAQLDASKILSVLDLADFPAYETPTRNRRIVNGREVKPNSIPWQVAILFNSPPRTTLCGGSILSAGSVLSSARCHHDTTGATVIAGAHNRLSINEPNQQRVSLVSSAYRIHPNYNRVNLNSDLMIMVLPSRLQLTDFVKVVRLPIGFEKELFVGEMATVSGWGRIQNTGTNSAVLHSATVPVITNAECRARLNTLVIDTNICTDTMNGQGPCEGDHGGPVTVPRPGDSRPILIGVVSFFNRQQCAGLNPSASVRVTSFLYWIRKETV